jgi:arylsulfatase A-like enzyme
MPRFLRGTVVGTLALAALGAGCAKPHYIVATPRTVDPAAWPATRRSSHVVLVSIDGLRPDAITATSAPTLSRLMREGSFTLAATTILPSKTLPSHTSMLTGQPPETHGVRWNTVVSADMDLVEVPSVFGVARARGYQTAAFYSKPKFQPLQQPDALDYSQAPGGWFGGWKSDRTSSDVERYLAKTRPNLLFVHLADPDRAGHSAGWMGADYMRAVTAADQAVSRIAAAATAAFGPDGFTMIVTADHGGHGRDHGSDDPRDVTIPWIAWGAGVKPGQIQSPVRTMDTASTALWLLGVDEPSPWAGQPIISAFLPAPTTSPGG